MSLGLFNQPHSLITSFYVRRGPYWRTFPTLYFFQRRWIRNSRTADASRTDLRLCYLILWRDVTIFRPYYIYHLFVFICHVRCPNFYSRSHVKTWRFHNGICHTSRWEPRKRNSIRWVVVFIQIRWNSSKMCFSFSVEYNPVGSPPRFNKNHHFS